METSPENSNEHMIQIISASMQEKPDAELITMYSAYDDTQYSPEAFEAMRRVLQARGISTHDLPRSQPRSTRRPPVVHTPLPPTYITPRLQKLFIVFTLLSASAFLIMLFFALIQPAGKDIPAQIFALIFFLVASSTAYAWYVKAHPNSFGPSSRNLSKFLFHLFTLLCIFSTITGFGFVPLANTLEVEPDGSFSIVISDSPAPTLLFLTVLIVGGVLLLGWWQVIVSPTIRSDY
jgi:hypothetical protein